MKKAYVNWYEETIKYGVGLVAKVERKCDSMDVKKVFAEFDKTIQKRGPKREIFEKIIQKYRDPEKDKKEEKTPWKTLYIREVEMHNKTKETLAEAEARIRELEEQIEKLKKTANLVSKMRQIMDKQSSAEGVGAVV